MRLLRLFLAVLSVAATTIGSEMLVGRRAFRAEQERMLADGVQRLEQVPREVGDWQMTSESQFSTRVVETLDCRGHFCRTYKNPKGDSVNVVLLVGPPGPLVAHRPEVCMDGQGYQIVADKERVEFGTGQSPTDELFRSTFAVGNSGRQVVVYYGWARSGGFEAPDLPRLELGREPMLYKIQVSADANPSRRADGKGDAGREFVADFLPVLSGLRSSPAKQPSSEASADSLRPTAGTSWLNRVVERWIW